MTTAAPQADDFLARLSAAAAATVADAAPVLAAVDAGRWRRLAGILWRPGVVVTSRQALPRNPERYAVSVGGGEARAATLAGDDPGTNVAVLRVEGEGAPARMRRSEGEQAPGMLALLVGAGEGGRPTARLATVHATGPAWHSLAGGRIDRLLRLDGRLGSSEEGGPVLDAAGALLGMSTAGPRGRALVIPHETVERVLDPILSHGRVGRAWLGLGLQPVEVPAALREAAGGRESGLMVVGLAAGGPAEQAGVLPGDILLAFGGVSVDRPRGLAALLGPERVGQETELRLMRAGEVRAVAVTPAPRPAAAAA
ncbi:S1C family serine protease [Craurococcus roseus]|uniref:S1C family serine protease n=1 Tax=Craurococcus roseus TaxID=77585 RepID=A0ABP3PS76_9PROT